MTKKKIGLLIICLIGILYFYYKPTYIEPAVFNWDGIIIETKLQDTIEHYFRSFPDNGQVAMAIINGEQIQTIGLKREKGQFDPTNNKDDYFEIGSITKTLTTTLLSKLSSTGQLSKDDLLKDYLDIELKSGDLNPNEITLGHLANHTSGLPRLPGNIMKDVIVHKNDPYKNYDSKRLMDFLKKDLVLNARAGDKYLYSNLGVGLLANVMATKIGKTYEDLIVKEVCRPLDMSSTKISLDTKDRLVKGINASGEEVDNWTFKSLEGCGAIKSTLSDMVTYTMAHMIDTSYLSHTHQPTHKIDNNLSVGQGWHIMNKGDKSIVWHNGGTGGYTSCITFDKANQKAVITLTNISALSPQGAQTDKCTFALLNML